MGLQRTQRVLVLGQERPTLAADARFAQEDTGFVLVLPFAQWLDLGQPAVITVSVEPGDRLNPADDRPHSRACGFQRHEHGTDCSDNCPTCGGR